MKYDKAQKAAKIARTEAREAKAAIREGYTKTKKEKR
jgi:hypothetical protein